jgi:hypothetical protein
LPFSDMKARIPARSEPKTNLTCIMDALKNNNIIPFINSSFLALNSFLL